MRNLLKNERFGGRALVVGGGIGGSLCAAALARHFDKVVVFERDRLPEDSQARPGVPQGHHNHFMLAGGMQAIEELLPGIDSLLDSRGAPLSDWGLGVLQWEGPGKTVPRHECGVAMRNASRGLFEWAIRRKLGELANVEIRQRHQVTGLLPDPRGSGVTGLRARDLSSGSEHDDVGDLIVCSPGRHVKPLKRWLQSLGYEWPRESRIEPNVHYASRFYRWRGGQQPDWTISFYLRPGTALLCNFLENDTFLLGTCALGAAEEPPKTEAAFTRSFRESDVPLFYEMACRGEPISKVHGWRVTEDRMVHFEDVPHWPDGLVLVGDSVCAFNPIHGQGMSACARVALRLHHELNAWNQQSLRGFSGHMQKTVPEIYADPWWLSTNFDLQLSSTTGPAPSWVDLFGMWYLEQIRAAARRHPQVRQAFAAAKHMLRPVASLLAADVLVPTLRDYMERCDASSEASKDAYVPSLCQLTELSALPRLATPLQRPPSPAARANDFQTHDQKGGSHA